LSAKLYIDWHDLSHADWPYIDGILKPRHAMQTIEMLRAWGSGYPSAQIGAYLLNKDNDVKVVWPGVHFKIYRGLARQFLSMPWATYGGFIVSDQLEKQDLEMFKKRFIRDRVASIVVTLHPDSKIQMYQMLWGNNLRVKEMITHILDLSDGMERVWSGYAGRCRNQIRKAITNGLRVESVSSYESLAIYYEIYRDAMSLKKANVIPFEVFESLRSAGSLFQLWLAKRNEEVLGGIITLSYGEEVFYWAAAITPNGRHLYVNNILLHSAIEAAVASGKKKFNLGSSSGLEGVEHFKAGYGAIKQPYWQLKYSTIWSRLKLLSLQNWRKRKQ